MPENTAGLSDKSDKLTPAQLHRKVALLTHGLTTTDVARKAGVSRQTVWMVLMDRGTSANVRAAFERLTGKSFDPPPVPGLGTDAAEEPALARSA